MKLLKSLKINLNQIKTKLDLSSLRLRLTLGVAAVSAIGLSGIAIWMTWQMQQILIARHKYSIEYMAERFPQDVEIYAQMMPLETAVQKGVTNLTNNYTFLWVEDKQGKIIAESPKLDMALVTFEPIPAIPKIKKINHNYWLICGNPIQVNNQDLGKVYLAQNITSEQTMFLSLIRSLNIATILSISGITIAISLYVKNSLSPLQKLSQLTEDISWDKLGEVHITLETAPKEVKELAQTFDKMLSRLAQAWENERDLVSNVSHELRTPLTIVSGYLQSVLRRGDNLTPMQKEALEIANSEANRTIQLMQDLLDFARADSGRIHFDLQKVVVNDLLVEVIQMGKTYSNRDINLVSPNDLIIIDVAPNQFKQIILNLIDNAVKYSDVDKPITVTLSSDNGQAKIAVSDQGVGIPLAHQARIFERFYRVDEARNRHNRSVGLGLAIVKILVEGMNGTISVASQLEKGTTFTVSFPLV